MAKRPTPLMLKILRDMRDGLGTHHNCRGRSAHGGRGRCVMAMFRRGLFSWDRDGNLKVTDVGLAALAESEQKCGYCGRRMRVSAESFAENPWCQSCLNERLEKARIEDEQANGKIVGWAEEGGYMRPIREPVRETEPKVR